MSEPSRTVPPSAKPGLLPGEAQGYTLLELIVVLLILGAAAAVVAPSVGSLLWRSRLDQATERAAASAVAVHTEARGSTSGVIWRPGVIVTAEHALRRDEEIHVTLPDGRIAPATLAGRDPSTDLAVLRCAEVGIAPVEHGDAAETKVGSIALVVGRTRASGAVAALGVVSLVVPERRTWAGSVLAPYIRLDIGLQPTAVGGAVVDSQGRIVGVASPRFARFGAKIGRASCRERV